MAELSSSEHFNTILDFAFGIADRGVPLSLVLIEPDDWPAGELPGDKAEALEQLARDVADRTRRSDRVTRLTDTCFAALLMDCNRQGALIFADRLQVAAGEFSTMSGCTVSCAIATFAEGMGSSSDLLDAARATLSTAHRSGGDRIEIFGDTPGR